MISDEFRHKRKEFGWEKNRRQNKNLVAFLTIIILPYAVCVSLFIAVDCCIFFYVAYINL